MECAICGATELLVRDHDHRTGKIRGILCDPCNGRIAMLERKQQGRAKYKRWLATYKERIEAHLQHDTGFYYGAKDATWEALAAEQAAAPGRPPLQSEIPRDT